MGYSPSSDGDLSVSLLYIVGLVGVGVFAISGALAAGRKSLDLLGVVVIATVTAVGGGTLRDLLLDRTVFWLIDPTYLLVIIAAALITIPYVRYRPPPHNVLLVADALGLALYTIIGTQIAEQQELSGVIAALMGVLTGAGGGVIRDVLTAEVPLLLRRGHLYATTAIAGAASYLILQDVGVERLVAAGIGMTIIIALRFASIWWGLSLPVFSLQDPPKDGTI